ncbi:cytochrome P450 [Actinomadura barringtoniae]|uniref:Cytochrome P450 n=1 Tax=Actinomadura barringtoniae TaxID=1427535 RepID=A0A939PD40_9ACTN|nr:cytochrome P450 [Actinomadura barringtoniae]MBO2447464.1 cytochrome P450 [Actinomadura barringtoniae]
MTPPPGPRGLGLLSTARFFAQPVKGMEAARRRYGPVFMIKFPGFPAEVFLTTADLAERAYATDAEGGRAGEIRRQFLEQLVGRHSLLTLDHEPWWRHRRLISPPLHGRAIARWKAEIGQIAADEIAGWPLNRPFPLRDRMQRITLEVIVRLVFGMRESPRGARLRAAIPELIEIAGRPTLLFMPPRALEWMLTARAPRGVPFLPTTRFAEVRAEVDDILFAEIAARRMAPDPDATDVLSMLLAARDENGNGLTDQELRDELITLLEAGHETTATALAWTFERLLRNRPVLDRLRAEVAEGEEETYLEAVVKESLRSRPVVYDVPRLLDKPLELNGHRAEAGWMVSPLIMLIHRDPEAFPDPDAFRPERFLGPDAARANKAWMPFGGGRRYCVGAQLALMEMRVITREVLRAVDLRAVDPAPERPKVRHVTLVPAKRARVVARQVTNAQEPPQVQERPQGRKRPAERAKAV